ncbi:hypothetical protein ACFWA4_05870 [Streptomyces sp. NPDC060011]|uniref:hypothetical protein n=1 Tax=Streptomyces sp. NPDC060011 TaxID=3347037 RepID=UPI0036B99095
MATCPTVELKVGSTWTDITTYVRYQDMIEIRRGRSAEATQTDTASCTMTLDNRDGRFSPRNPVGAYYGLIGRNTPIKVSIDGGLPYLNLPGGSGDKSSTPDTASLDITGDIDIRVEMFLLDWNTASETEVIGKYNATGNQRSWRLTIDTGGYPKLTWSADGSTLLSATSTASLARNGRSRLALRVTLDVNNGAGGRTVNFYTADTMSGTWTALGSAVTVAGTTSIFSSSATLEIGDISNPSTTPPTCRVYKAQLLNGIAGPVVANPDYTVQTVGAASFADSAGRTWTQSGNAAISNRKIRFMGEVSSWPVEWDVSGKDVVTKIEASGIIRRLTQSESPLRSPMFREFTNPQRTHIVGYWPLEDADGSASFASGIPGHPVMTYSGSPELASAQDWAGSESLPAIESGILTAVVPAYTVTGETSTRFLMKVPAAGVVAETLLLSLKTTGSARRWEVRLTTAGSLKLRAYDGEDNELLGLGAASFVINGRLVNLVLELTQSGADINYRLIGADYTNTTTVDVSIPGSGAVSGTLLSFTVGQVSRITIGEGGLAGTTIGHVSIADETTAYAGTANAIVGYRNENTRDRLWRLVESEESVPLQMHSRARLGSTVTLGVQGVKGLVELARDCGDTDLGILYEPRDEIGLAYRSRLSLYNQTPRLALDYALHQLAGPPIPVDDDRYTRNDITVTRENGSFANAVLDTGPLSVQAPPDGVGRYEEDVTISVGSDDQLPDQAGWRLHLGTIDEARYPQIELNLRHSTFTSSASMMEDALELEVGDRATIANPPSWLPPDRIDLLAVGFSERYGVLERDITVNCVPESAYHVAFVEGDDYERADTDGSSLNSSASSSATSISVATQAGSAAWVDSVTHPTEFPFDVRVGGEVMTVTAISGTTSPQTFTVTRSVNGVVKSQSSGADVRLATPAIISL